MRGVNWNLLGKIGAIEQNFPTDITSIVNFKKPTKPNLT